MIPSPLVPVQVFVMQSQAPLEGVPPSLLNIQEALGWVTFQVCVRWVVPRLAARTAGFGALNDVT